MIFGGISGGGTEMNADPAVTETLADLWTNFAKTGNPNGGMNVTWPGTAGRWTSILISTRHRW